MIVKVILYKPYGLIGKYEDSAEFSITTSYKNSGCGADVDTTVQQRNGMCRTQKLRESRDHLDWQYSATPHSHIQNSLLPTRVQTSCIPRHPYPPVTPMLHPASKPHKKQQHNPDSTLHNPLR